MRGTAARDVTILESRSLQFIPAAGESIKDPDRGKICVLLRNPRNRRHVFDPTIRAESQPLYWESWVKSL